MLWFWLDFELFSSSWRFQLIFFHRLWEIRLFWRSRLRLKSENAQELQDKRGVLVVKWREAVVMGAVVRLDFELFCSNWLNQH